MNNDKTFTTAEQQRIESEVKAYQEKDKAREAAIQTEIKNRILDAERQQPGKRYY